MTPFAGYTPDWRWGTAEGSRDFDRLLDRALTFREKLEWLEEAETLTLQLRASREGEKKLKAEYEQAGAVRIDGEAGEGRR